MRISIVIFLNIIIRRQGMVRSGGCSLVTRPTRSGFYLNNQVVVKNYGQTQISPNSELAENGLVA